MLQVARQVFDILLAGTSGAVSLVSSLFTLSHAIGYVVVNNILLAYHALSDCILAAAMLAQVLYEDFGIFFTDFSYKIFDITIAVFSSLTATFSTAKNTVLGISTFVLFAYESVSNFVNLLINLIFKGLELFVDIAELAKLAVILTGNGFWFALQLVPLSLVYVSYSISILIFNFFDESFNHLSKWTNVIYTKAILAGNWILNYIFVFPLESIFGLLLGTCVIFIVVKFYSRIYRALINSVRRTIRLIRTAVMCVGLVIMDRLRNWRRNRPVMVIDINDSDSNEDDEPRVTVRRSPRIQARAGLQSTTKETPEVLRRQLERELEEKLCVVCQDEKRHIIVMPCRHLCLCYVCSAIIQRTTGTCPICRQGINRTLSVFM